MKPLFVRDLPAHVNETVVTSFLVRSKETRLKKTGEPYLSMMLGDRTGEVEARVWENPESVSAFERDDFLKVKGLVQVFRNKPQLSIHKLRRLGESEIELADFFPCTERDVEQMFAELCAAVAEMRNAHLRALLEALLGDPEIAARLKRAPAARTIHHAYFGGLLEHVVSLCGLSRTIAAHYPSLDLDLLVTGAVLHDLGKVHELDYARSIAYTTEGQLLGHMVLGLDMVGRKLHGMPDFPASLRVLVEHLIISHHGQYEFGSPKLPMFPEALVFHYLDDLDSKVNSMSAQFQNDLMVAGDWTAKNASLGRPLLKREEYLRSGGLQAAAGAEDGGPKVAATATGEAGGLKAAATAPGEDGDLKAAATEADGGQEENGNAS